MINLTQSKQGKKNTGQRSSCPRPKSGLEYIMRLLFNFGIITLLGISLGAFNRESWALITASGLWSATSRESRPPKTSRRRPCKLCRSWTQDPARRHCGSIRSTLPRNCEWLRDNTSCYRSRPHRCRSRAQHIGDKRFWSCGTAWGNWNISGKLWVIHFLITSTKFVCFASLTVTTAWTSSINFCFSSSSKFMYHFASLVFPALFWIRMNRI